jgi:tetratricopeptide (TPR) repeat protein
MSGNPTDLIARAEQRLDWAENLLDDDNPQAALRECKSAADFAEQAGDIRNARAVLADAHNLRGVILEELGHLIDARGAYQAALKIDPDFTEAYKNLRALQRDLEKHGGLRRDDLGGPPFAHVTSASGPLATIDKFGTALEAEVVRGLLETSGIPAFIFGENAMGAWMGPNTTFGVRLQVRVEDEDRARDVLAAAPIKDDSAGVDEAGFEDEVRQFDDADLAETCPACGSDRFHKRTYIHFGSLLEWITLGSVSQPIMRRHWKCNTCGRAWD